MHILFLVVFFVCFCLIAGSAFAMMYANLQSINEDMNRLKKRRHPEAPQPGEEVMYVDVSSDTSAEFAARKQMLEDLYND